MIKATTLTAAIFFAATISGHAYTMLKSQSTTTGFDHTVQCEDGRVLEAKQMSGNYIIGGNIYGTFDEAMVAANCK